MEIERKFLVDKIYLNQIRNLAYKNDRIRQGYLINDKNIQVRVRIKNFDSAYLTVKSNNCDISRQEYEIPIPQEMAIVMLSSCQGVIEKHRYSIKWDNHIFEIDEFAGKLKGLILAEVELDSADESVQLPEFIGEEVTGNPNYYNSNLIKQAYEIS